MLLKQKSSSVNEMVALITKVRQSGCRGDSHPGDACAQWFRASWNRVMNHCAVGRDKTKHALSHHHVTKGNPEVEQGPHWPTHNGSSLVNAQWVLIGQRKLTQMTQFWTRKGKKKKSTIPRRCRFKNEKKKQLERTHGLNAHWEMGKKFCFSWGALKNCKK